MQVGAEPDPEQLDVGRERGPCAALARPSGWLVERRGWDLSTCAGERGTIRCPTPPTPCGYLSEQPEPAAAGALELRANLEQWCATPLPPTPKPPFPALRQRHRRCLGSGPTPGCKARWVGIAGVGRCCWPLCSGYALAPLVTPRCHCVCAKRARRGAAGLALAGTGSTQRTSVFLLPTLKSGRGGGLEELIGATGPDTRQCGGLALAWHWQC